MQKNYASFLKFETSFIFLTNQSVVLGICMKRARRWEISICDLLEVSQLERYSLQSNRLHFSTGISAGSQPLVYKIIT